MGPLAQKNSQPQPILRHLNRISETNIYKQLLKHLKQPSIIVTSPNIKYALETLVSCWIYSFWGGCIFHWVVSASVFRFSILGADRCCKGGINHMLCACVLITELSGVCLSHGGTPWDRNKHADLGSIHLKNPPE